MGHGYGSSIILCIILYVGCWETFPLNIFTGHLPTIMSKEICFRLTQRIRDQPQSHSLCFRFEFSKSECACMATFSIFQEYLLWGYKAKLIVTKISNSVRGRHNSSRPMFAGPQWLSYLPQRRPCLD